MAPLVLRPPRSLIDPRYPVSPAFAQLSNCDEAPVLVRDENVLRVAAAAWPSFSTISQSTMGPYRAWFPGEADALVVGVGACCSSVVGWPARVWRGAAGLAGVPGGWRTVSGDGCGVRPWIWSRSSGRPPSNSVRAVLPQCPNIRGVARGPPVDPVGGRAGLCPGQISGGPTGDSRSPKVHQGAE